MGLQPQVHNRRMDKDQLDGLLPFLAVAEHLRFTRAARALHVSPTAGVPLYFPARAQLQPALRAVIDTLRQRRA